VEPHRKQRAEVELLNYITVFISLLFSRMTLNTLEHGNISQVDRMFEWLVRFVAGLAFAIGKATKIDRMLNRQSLKSS
jgi:hypothetical protein